jgi:methylase of polypeptide subunit release factors
MPRLSRQWLAQAYRENWLLPQLLQTCRDLPSARRELRWLKERAGEWPAKEPGPARFRWRRDSLLQELVRQRARGVPLQYLMGTEFFGNLEIACRPGVLIPRQETAAAVSNLLTLFENADKEYMPDHLRILDLCTGTGCIALLSACQFPYLQRGSPTLEVLGVDVSPKAVALAKLNQRKIGTALLKDSHITTSTRRDGQSLVNGRRFENLATTEFVRADVLAANANNMTQSPPSLMDALKRMGKTRWDIIISNPPYISPNAFDNETTRSVRNFEPRLALVPPGRTGVDDDETQGDLFYPRILQIAETVGASIVLMEVANLEQATRVAQLAKASRIWDGIEIWRDQPNNPNQQDRPQTVLEDIPVIGEGYGRSVFCWRGEARPWIGR